MGVSDKKASKLNQVDWKRLGAMLLGIALFVIVYFSPAWPDAVDPDGKHFVLSQAAKGGLAIFLLAGVWWVFEVLPIGVTSLAIGALQVLFCIRKADVAFRDFMAPSVLFIFGSIVIGMVFTKTGLTRRLAYRMLMIVGERTSMIMLGCFVVTAALTHIMAHTAVAATIYPLLLAIYSLYGEGERPTRFGKCLFMGMAYVAGAGSIVTLLGAARGAVAIEFFKKAVGSEIGFFQLSWYMFPIGWIMVFLLWGFFMVFLKPEKKTIPGLKEQSTALYRSLGPLTRNEILAVAIVSAMIVVLGANAFLKLEFLNKTAILLVTTILFFLFKVLDIRDLENIPWNIILLFGGAMSIGFCLVETKAADWLAIQCLGLIKDAPWFLFVMGVSFFVLLMTNFIMNVAAIAITLPVALIIAPKLGVSPEIMLFASLVVAGMPFLLLVGAAPNAIAYDSKQFTSGEFFRYGIPASVMLMVVLGFFVMVVWKAMGMEIIIPVG